MEALHAIRLFRSRSASRIPKLFRYECRRFDNRPRSPTQGYSLLRSSEFLAGKCGFTATISDAL